MKTDLYNKELIKKLRDHCPISCDKCFSGIEEIINTTVSVKYMAPICEDCTPYKGKCAICGCEVVDNGLADEVGKWLTFVNKQLDDGNYPIDSNNTYELAEILSRYT